MWLLALFRMAGTYGNCVPDPFLSVPWGPLGLDPLGWVCSHPRVSPPLMAQVSCGVVLPQDRGPGGSVSLFHPTEVHFYAPGIGAYRELVGYSFQDTWQEQKRR